MNTFRLLLLGMVICCLQGHAANFPAQHTSISGIYPHLAMFNEEDECGTGAVVPWADRLWVITYAPHKPRGSTDKLYEITAELDRTIRPESIGGTPANRMIHPESGQLFIGPYAIDTNRTVRVIPYSRMFGRPTGTTRHLFDPAHKVVYATMEEGFYEVDVRTLEVTELWADEQLKSGRKAELPGYHGKGLYASQGRYVFANNGDHSATARTNPAAPSGVLAEWDGKADHWTIVRTNQFTEVTGPGGIRGNSVQDDRLWSIGWDHRSLILMLKQNGRWSSFRLPKASHAYDGAHGWNTEWPRIREIGNGPLLMTMHGSLWKFPAGFSKENSSGIAPRSTYLKVIGDFCRWQDRIVFGCDDTARSEFLNKSFLKGKLAAPGKSQSNLWFVEKSQLDHMGPPLGRGAVWLKDNLRAGEPSEPFLFSGFARRSLFLLHETGKPVSFRIELDEKGNGHWTELSIIAVPPKGAKWLEFSVKQRGSWIRLTPASDVIAATAYFHYRAEDNRDTRSSPVFNGIATAKSKCATGGLLHVQGGTSTLRLLARNETGEIGCYDFDRDLHLKRVSDPSAAAQMRAGVSIPLDVITADDSSVLYVDDQQRRWRLPRNPKFDRPGPPGPERLCREVCTERNLLNVHGCFYELPADNAGGFAKLRPIASHNFRISDFASYRGLLVISGLEASAKGKHIVRSDDGQCALWFGAVDDLWKLGKPRGIGGPWKNSLTHPNQPSDAYLMTGYDRKQVELSNMGSAAVRIRLEVDVSGDDTWASYREFAIGPGKQVRHRFPDSFAAYWVRAVADASTTATVQFTYD